MKRFLSIFISIAMLVCMLPMTGMATSPAEDDAEKLVFDMDLSEFDGTDVSKITNAVLGNDSVIAKGLTNLPAVNEIVAGGQKYLTFSYDSGIKVTDDEAFLNQNELTVEMWMRPTDYQSSATTSGRAFVLGSYLDFYKYRGGPFYYNPAGDSSLAITYTDESELEKGKNWQISASFNNRDERWTHVVFTRKWVPDETTTDDTDDGTWYANWYIDGVKANATDKTMASLTRRTEAANTPLNIGYGYNRGENFYGDIATFKVYQSILTDEQVSTKFEESKPAIVPENAGANPVFDLDLETYSEKGVNRLNSSLYGHAAISVNGSPTLNTLPNGVPYMSFSGTGQYLTVSDNDNYVGMDAQTIEYWVRSEQFGVRKGAYQRGWNLGKSALYLYNYETIYFEPVGDTGAYSGTVVSGSLGSKHTNQWTHIVTTKEWDTEANGWISNMYINGVKTSASPMTVTHGKGGAAITAPTEETSATLKIGGTTATCNIADFKVYKSVLDADTVKANYLADKDMFSEVGDDKLVFDMDLSSSTEDSIVVTSKDSGSGLYTVSGTPAIGTLEGGQKYLTLGSSTTDGVKVADYALTNQNAMTVETWIRPTDFDNGDMDDQRLFNADWMVGRLWNYATSNALWWEAAGDANNSLRYINSGVSSINNKWSHLVFTRRYDEIEGKWYGDVYLNGTHLGGKTLETARAEETSNVLVIGNNTNASGNQFIGDIATFKVYNTVLSPNAISAKYANAKPNFYDMVTIDAFTTESTSVTANVDATLTAQTPFVVMALYDSADANANMLKAVAGTTIDLTEVELQEGYVVKCFVWNNITDLKPLVGAAEAICQGL